MISLSSLTRKDVVALADSPQIFQRGEAYHRGRSIYQYSVSAEGVTAKLHGNYGDYSVTIMETPAGLETNCDCPYDGKVCKHVVAALLRFLEGEFEPRQAYQVSLQAALEQTLTAMPDREIVALVLKLASERIDFRRLIWAVLRISPQTNRQQARSPVQVEELQAEIRNFLITCQDYSNYDGYLNSYTDEEYPGLESVFEAVRMLHPADQIEVYWEALTFARNLFDGFPVALAQFKRATSLYSQAVRTLELTPPAKWSYLDALVAALDWDMCSEDRVSESLKAALDDIASAPEDYRRLISKFEKSCHPQAQDWIAEYHLRLGDDVAYLRVRQNNLRTEAQFLDLAHYWKRKGETTKYVATLEAWVVTLSESKCHRVPNGWPRTGKRHGKLLAELAEHYRDCGDNESLCRVLFASAKHDGLNFITYRQIKAVATELGNWRTLRPRLFELVKSTPELLVQIYLAEEEWMAVINLANRKRASRQVQAIIADELKQHRPDVAVEIYQRLVQRYIGFKGRRHQSAIRHYVGRIKVLYLAVLRDSASWQQYIKSMRQRYPKHPGLKEIDSGC